MRILRMGDQLPTPALKVRKSNRQVVAQRKVGYLEPVGTLVRISAGLPPEVYVGSVKCSPGP